MKIQIATKRTVIVDRAVGILRRELKSRGGIDAEVAADPKAGLVLDVKPGIGEEGFRIEGKPGEPVVIRGNDDRGLLYGVGKFLHTCRFGVNGESARPHGGRLQGGRVECERQLSTWRGTSVPTGHVRGMYPAYNFKNWYVSAPREDVLRYCEELALWGLNSLAFVTAHHQHASMDAPETPALRRTIDDNTRLMKSLREVGFRIGVLSTGNIGFAYGPPGSAAVDVPDTTPARRGNVDPRICPSHPEGWAHMESTYGKVLDVYREVGLDYLVTFPYDAGGCGCAKCWPWGSNGFLRMNKMLSRLMRERFPECKLVFGTWCFDARGDFEGEWEGLARELAKDKSWVHYIMADSHEDFPRYPLEKGVPGGLPLVNFAEISMWGRYPWGGYGANPLPARFQRLWDQIKHVCDGGFPYSEGIYEDIDKAICAGFYWDREAKAEDIVREYVSYEYSPDAVEPVMEAIRLMERTYPRETWQKADVERAYEIILDVDRRLPERAKTAWRWRVLYLRAVIDHELVMNPDKPHSDRCDEAFEELTRIYHAEATGGPDAPPSRRCRARLAAEKAAAQPPPPGSTAPLA